MTQSEATEKGVEMANQYSDNPKGAPTDSLFERLNERFNKERRDPLFQQIDRNAKALLRTALARLDVVSREEFDAQTAVLKRTRQRLEALEQQIDVLNDQLSQEQGS